MLEIFRNYVRERDVSVSDEELDYWMSLLIQKRIKKNEFLLREGEVCKYIAFVVKGCLRLYTVDDKGKEHIMQFAPENWWISDMDSFARGTPSDYFIDALEDSEVLVVDAPSQEKIMMNILPAALFFQRLVQNVKQ